MQNKGKLITLAIHTYEKSLELKQLLEKEGIEVVIHNVNLQKPVISSGVRVRIYEKDLPLALQIIENNPNLSSSLSIGDEQKTNKKGKILIPIDFSDYSYKACCIGFDFASHLNCKVVILHSFMSVNYSGSLPFNSDGFSTDIVNVEESKELKKVVHERMIKLSKKLKDSMANGTLPKIDFETQITEGVPEEAILDYAKQCKPQIIVMGTRGKDKKEIELIGSVTAEVLDSGKFPVFTVPENISISKVGDIKNVVFFNNLCQEDLISFDIFERMFSNEKLNVTLISIPEKKENNIDLRNAAVLDYCRTHYPTYVFTIKNILDKNFLQDFEQFVFAEKIDLIIIPNRKKNIFARLFNPSIAHKMLFHSDTPMLAVPVG